MSKQLLPSYRTQQTRIYLKWTELYRCKNCGFLGHNNDINNSHPCPECGDKASVVYGSAFETVVGRWVWTEIKDPAWWKFWKPVKRKGHWEVKK